MRYRVWHLMKVIGLLMVALLTLTGVTQAAGTGWSVVTSPNPSLNGNVLQAVAAISTNKVWAVGYSLHGTTKSSLVKRTLIERFNGTSWGITNSPNSGAGDNVLNGVTAISATNAWAVGSSANGALVLHYNGQKWSIVSAPVACQFNAVKAISATDVWAVGTTSGQPCAEHFNGSGWVLVHTPLMGTADNTLLGVTAVSSKDVWAVGTYCVGNGCDRGGGIFQTMIFHYDGSRWSVMPSPNPGALANRLNAVVAISATNVWAVGSDNNDPLTSSSLILHFDGKSWFQVVSPGVKGSSTLYGVAAVSATDLYAVGSASIPTAPAYPTLIVHFDGNAWSIVSSPSPGTHNALNAVARVPGAALGSAQFWAVGAYDNNAPSLTLTERDI